VFEIHNAMRYNACPMRFFTHSKKNLTIKILSLSAASIATADPNPAIPPECRYEQKIYYNMGSCFSGDTLVTVQSDSTPESERTTKKISSIKKGDMVLSWDNTYKTFVSSKVTDVYYHMNRVACTLTLEDGTKTQTTPEHRFAFKSDALNTEIQYDFIGLLHSAFLNHAKLSGATSFRKLDNNSNSMKAVKGASFSMPEYIDVYSIEVDVTHNYFANGILVHNKK